MEEEERLVSEFKRIDNIFNPQYFSCFLHVHSYRSLDGLVLSYDIKTGRRLMRHLSMNGGSTTCMAQRIDSEQVN